MFTRFSRLNVEPSEYGNGSEGSIELRQLSDYQILETESAPSSWHTNNQSPDDVSSHLRRRVNTSHTICK